MSIGQVLYVYWSTLCLVVNFSDVNLLTLCLVVNFMSSGQVFRCILANFMSSGQLNVCWSSFICPLSTLCLVLKF